MLTVLCNFLQCPGATLAIGACVCRSTTAAEPQTGAPELLPRLSHANARVALLEVLVASLQVRASACTSGRFVV